MDRQELFGRILESLYAGVLDDARWPATSGLIDEFCGSKGNSLVFGDGAAQDDVDIFFAQTCFRGQRHVELEQEYFAVYHAVDERVPRIRSLPDSQLTPAPSLFSEAEMKTSAVYNELLPRIYGRDGFIVRLDGPNRSRIVWGIGGPVDGDGWSSERVGTIERLLPHLRQFVRVRQALVGARALGASVFELLDNVRVGVIQLDRRARVVAANDRARALLRRNDGLSDGNGRLRASLPGEDETLQRLLARALPFPGGPGAGGSMPVSGPETLSRLVVHVSPLHDAEVEPGRSHAGALVLAVDPAERPGIAPERLVEALGLTPAESRIAVSVAQGKGIDAVAAETGRSRTTVKWHLRNIYAKHGLSGQMEMVQLVMSLAEFPELRG